jgi:hypothetical protein
MPDKRARERRAMGEGKRRRSAGTHGPIEADQHKIMNALAQAIDEFLNPGDGPKKIGFVLLSARFGDIAGGRVNYISNGDRKDMIGMMRELIARFEGRHAEETQTGAPGRPQ